ncbi:nitroreductase family deazaflavin-dependent oxidoreductase [Saccharomonospora saliphila]|uniref:nitroreductase family deazaflavin-dependent oxidoreductase n=1 Tax=Saccharomonospora saliphila TaxID=369829 RepID=UPI000490C918|nr:nitroreductase family deazaflavin-dependent oxidoreductase [Saccharomonospora saliphila]
MTDTGRGAPPRGWMRALLRLPVALYRLGLGGLAGRRLLLLRHTGRVSGHERRTVLEVVERSGGGYVVASGFGPRADWYRNVCAVPEATVVVGRTPLPVTAWPLPRHEGEAVMMRYAERHPAAARLLCRRVMGFDVDGSADDFRAVGRTIPFVRFLPRECA